jgi:pyroglutamyl-peptidase
LKAEKEEMRVLITGFGPFPRAPFNPSALVAKTLARRRRPALAGLVRDAHVFATEYACIDRDVPRLFAQQPDVVLMFGLAGRARELRIETRARNAMAPLLPDAGKYRRQRGTIEFGAPAARRGPAPFARLAAAIRSRGLPVRVSRDAGTYLCNYAYWRALSAASGRRPLVLFVHIPLVPMTPRPRRRVRRRSLSLKQIISAGENLLIALAAAARR